MVYKGIEMQNNKAFIGKNKGIFLNVKRGKNYGKTGKAAY